MLTRLRRRAKKAEEQVAVVLEPASLGGEGVESAPVPAEESAPVPAEADLNSMEAIAKKHLGDKAEAVLGKYNDFLKELVEEDDEAASSVIDHARRLEVFSDTAPLGPAVPHPESNPDKRVDGAVSPVVVSADAPDLMLGIGHPETLLDLFHAFPQLDGVNWFIYVERLEPRIYAGTRCDGMLRPIERQIDLLDWQQWYGGGKYKLIVYGPPKNGSVVGADGRVSPRKLTEAITVKSPGPPSFESIVYDDGPTGDPMSESAPQQHSFPPRRGPMTPADASVENKRIDVGDTREQRLREDVLKAQEKAEKALKEQQGGQNAIVAELMKSNREAQARESEARAESVAREREHQREMRELIERTEERFRALLSEQPKKPDDVERLVSLTSAMNKGGASLDSLREQHQREVERMSEQRAQAESAHQRAIADERARADQRIRDAEERADRRIKDAEDRASNESRELRSRLEQEAQRQRDEQARQLADEHRRTTERISDLERIHARDLQALKDGFARDVETLKMTHDMRLDTTRSELKRTEAEAERYRLEAEKGKDIVGQIEEAKERAAALGMVDASEAAAEPETVPQMLIKAGTGILGNLPGVLETMATMMRGKDQQQLQLAREQGAQEAMRRLQQPALLPASTAPHPGRRGQTRAQIATQGPLSPIPITPAPLIPGKEPRPRPDRSSIRPITADMQPEEVMQIEEAMRARDAEAARLAAAVGQSPPTPQQLQMQQMSPASIPPEALFVPQPAPEPQQVLPPEPMGLDGLTPEQQALYNEDVEIVATEAMLMQPFEGKASPVMLAQTLYGQYPEQMKFILPKLGSADRVSQAFMRQRGPAHAFALRDGKKFLRELFGELTRLVGAAG